MHIDELMDQMKSLERAWRRENYGCEGCMHCEASDCALGMEPRPKLNYCEEWDDGYGS